MLEKKKAKAGRKRNDSGSREEDGKEYSNNNSGISFWIVFTWPEYSISSFEENISKQFLAAEFDLISCKAIRSRMFYIKGVTTGDGGGGAFSHTNIFAVAMRPRIFRNVELLIVDIV